MHSQHAFVTICDLLCNVQSDSAVWTEEHLASMVTALRACSALPPNLTKSLAEVLSMLCVHVLHELRLKQLSTSQQCTVISANLHSQAGAVDKMRALSWDRRRLVCRALVIHQQPTSWNNTLFSSWLHMHGRAIMIEVIHAIFVLGLMWAIMMQVSFVTVLQLHKAAQHNLLMTAGCF